MRIPSVETSPTKPQKATAHLVLTDAKLNRATNHGPSDWFLRDSSLQGFGARISPRNVKSFFVEGTIKGRFHRHVIGRFPLITVTEARRKAIEALRDIKYGECTSAKKDASEALLRALAEAFLKDKESTLRPSTLLDYTRVLQGDYFSDWMDAPIKGITRRLVLNQYQNLCIKHGIGMANKSMRVLSSVLNYGKAIDPSLEEWANPIRVLTEARARKQLKPRTGHIPPNKLNDWFSALETYVGEARSETERARRSEIRVLFILLLMTGLRSKEASTLKWSQIDFDNGTLRIHEEKAKNHQELVIPLNSWLLNELREKANRSNAETYVFSKNGRSFGIRTANDDGSIDNLRRAHQRIGELAGLVFTPHDLRRSFATYLDITGAPFSVIKQLLNHKSKTDITERYIQANGTERLRQHTEAVLSLILCQREELSLRATISTI